jgi:hypothetical protein
MKYFYFAILTLLLSACYPESVASPPKPDIYITRIERMLTFEGREAWILDYTVNGAIQTAVFDSQKAVTEFREYLDTIGKVYQREDER